MVEHHPDPGKDVLAMTIKSIVYKGPDNNPKPEVLPRSTDILIN
jgi:hypothetical protein